MSPDFKPIQCWPAGRMDSTMARGPEFVAFVVTFVRPAGQPLCLPTPDIE